MMIRTPDQRVRVFVSSTMQELAAERQAVAAAIRQLRLTPVLFEFGARPYPPRDLYRAYLEQSDVFIGIYAESYGWVGPGMEVSGLEDEYRLSAGKPRLIYVKKRRTSPMPNYSAAARGCASATVDRRGPLVESVLIVGRQAPSSDQPVAAERPPHRRPVHATARPRTCQPSSDPDMAAALFTSGDGEPAACRPAGGCPAAQSRSVGGDQTAPDTVLADVPVPQR
jgi:hypothetical protein